MHAHQSQRLAFTMAEIIVVVTIVIILAGVAFSSTNGVIKNLRFNNAFNKMVLMVQEGRNLAATGKDSSVLHYGIDFVQEQSSSPYEVILYSEANGAVSLYSFTKNVDREIGKLQLPQGLSIALNNPRQSPTCNGPSASLFFTRSSGTMEIFCPNPTSLEVITVGVAEGSPTQPIRTKTFTIHKAAGIPQIQ